MHAERAIRRLAGSIAHFWQNIEEVQTLLWDYYQMLKAYQQEPTTEQQEHPDAEE